MSDFIENIIGESEDRRTALLIEAAQIEKMITALRGPETKRTTRKRKTSTKKRGRPTNAEREARLNLVA